MPRLQANCRYFARGICTKGNACLFAHDMANEKIRSEKICQFNLIGKCSNGQACRFKHTLPTDDERPTTSRVQTTQHHSNNSPSQQEATLASARVRHVQRVQPGQEGKTAECVPSWKMTQKMPNTSYAPTTASSSYHNGECSSSSTMPPRNAAKLSKQKPRKIREKEKQNQNESLISQSQEKERTSLLQKTETKKCGNCKKLISENNLRFGILNGCSHCFCLDCIRQRRSEDGESARRCPVCNKLSDYVIPSFFWVEKGEEKDLLIATYKENTKSIVCKYYSNTRPKESCLFGNKCFYKHQLPDGSIDPGESSSSRDYNPEPEIDKLERIRQMEEFIRQLPALGFGLSDDDDDDDCG